MTDDMNMLLRVRMLIPDSVRSLLTIQRDNDDELLRLLTRLFGGWAIRDQDRE